MKEITCDVAVFGAGITGLMLSTKLSELGFSVACFERNQFVADGPSTRNEGWLHRGTYHANSIPKRSEALRVARRCMYGHDQIQRFAPEAIEDRDANTFALLRFQERVDECLDRWNEAGVQYARQSKSELSLALPNLNLRDVSAGFLVQDKSINTRILLRKYLGRMSAFGAKLYTGVHIQQIDGSVAQILDRGISKVVHAKKFVFCVGYGAHELLRTVFQRKIGIRYWKSHLLVLPRQSEHSAFFLDPGGAAGINHSTHTIVGLNEDATRVEAPSFDTDREGVHNLIEAAQRLFPGASAGSPTLACCKVDIAPDERDARSLNVSITELSESSLLAFPGKMTEAPYVTDMLAQILCEELPLQLVSERPMDRLTSAHYFQ